jgi:hypothetical protein
MALTQADLDRLDTNIARGVLEVEVDGERVRFPSIQDMKERRSLVDSLIKAQAAAASGAVPCATLYPTFRHSREG